MSHGPYPFMVLRSCSFPTGHSILIDTSTLATDCSTLMATTKKFPLDVLNPSILSCSGQSKVFFVVLGRRYEFTDCACAETTPMLSSFGDHTVRPLRCPHSHKN